MNFFEDTTQAKQPYAAVDSPPVLTYEDMEASFDENIGERARAFAKDIYEHWKSRRLEAGNKPLITSLKVRRNLGLIPLLLLTCRPLVGDRCRNGRCRPLCMFP